MKRSHCISAMLAALIALCAGFFTLDQSLAVVNNKVVFHEFPVPPYVTRQVWFWEGIFNRYNSDVVLIHDAHNPELIIDLIDFNVFAKQRGLSLFSRLEKERLTARYLERYELALQRFRKYGQDALRYGAMEKRIYSVYRRNNFALTNLFKGKVLIRSQAGLADEFSRAVERAKDHLPYMEEIFIKHKIPSDLTRIAFVESMFNPKARSKVGAVGVWQLMKATARHYIRVNPYFDERISPIKATKAAAMVLKENYAALNNWPLAITAYNHGRAGMRRAATQVGSSDISKIIRFYRSPSFGFASRNFYAEFLAARNLYNTLHHQRWSKEKSQVEFTPIVLIKPVSLTEIVNNTPLDVKTLKSLNPCLLPSAFSRYRYEPLPPYFEIVVPTNLAPRIKLALQNLDSSQENRRSL